MRIRIQIKGILERKSEIQTQWKERNNMDFHQVYIHLKDMLDAMRIKQERILALKFQNEHILTQFQNMKKMPSEA